METSGVSQTSEAISPLSEREREVLELVATGASNQEVARALVISPNTVKVHLRNIFEKLAVQSRTEATMEAVRRGWITLGAEALSAPSPVADASPLPPTASPVSPLPRWKRLYMVAAAALVITVALLPALLHTGRSAALFSPMTDAGRPQGATEIRPQALRWRVGAALPEARSRLALVAGPAALYAIGGETSEGVTGRVDAYAPDVNLWRRARDKPTAVSNIAGATFGDRIYVPGGITADGAVSDVVEVYDPASDAWEAVAPLPAPRAAYALAALGDKLYLFGGYDGEKYRAETFIYDPAGDRWSAGPPLPAARGFAAAGALGEMIYLVGGYDGTRELDRVDAFDPADGSWTARDALDQPRAGLGLAVMGTRLYAIGGGLAAPLNFNEQYDARSGAWSRIESPVVGEWRSPGVAAFGQNVYAVGGWGGGYLDVNTAYEAVIRLLLPFGAAGN